ncbi:hypothetical protein [Thermoactinomyces sp. DSM 45892]|uniref:hypothetical protein n=1 Tax=Thermoactinomyces sp. DSM 45892 TaxID=1882753 RepID=UPI000899B47D|nr:hypothetical protein [Thermoactinomyces sp. DSM 45892]SDY23967.1 hypothetical protein SAMN05444416_10366 [Thermoactinomyces sp. DSM 45892]
MQQQYLLNRDIISNEVEYSRSVYPVHYKYIQYENIREWLVPYICFFETGNLDMMIRNVKEIIRKNDLLRSSFNKTEDGQINLNVHKYNDDVHIPVYESSEDSIEDYFVHLSNDLKKRNIFGDALYNIAFIKHDDKKTYFLGVFNHMLSDGDFDFKNRILHGCTKDLITLDKINRYIDNIEAKNFSYFETYCKLKADIYSKYKIPSNESMMISFSSLFFFKHRNYTVEEFWYHIVYSVLFRLFPMYDELPICVLTNGRSFDDVVYAKDFGDFHDEIMLTQHVSSTREKRIDDYREYRKNPFKNAKEYVTFLQKTSIKEKQTTDYMEPLVLLISGQSPDSDYRIGFKKYLPRDKRHFLSIKVVCAPSLTSFKVYFLYSPEISDQMGKFEEIMLDEIEKLTQELDELT